MVLSSAPEQGTSLILIEGGLTAIAFAMAFCLPRLGSIYFARIERAFARLARRKSLSVAVVGFAAFLLRLAILPLCPIPLPFLPDDFSFLLAADTFASGRLTNPTPAMWMHFESIHVTMKPTYMSMYFPAQGLVLAAGKVLTGHPWYGVLVMSALMCAAICWMLQAWLPPSWALLGGILAVLAPWPLQLLDQYLLRWRLDRGLLAGALVLGALPRFMKAARLRYGLLLAVGVILARNCPPYEGLLLCLPVAVVLGRWMFFGKNRPAAQSCFAALLSLGAHRCCRQHGWATTTTAYSGSPLTPPYTINRAHIRHGALFYLAVTAARASLSAQGNAEFLLPR